MKGLLLHITFFTRIPIKYPYKYREEDFVKGIIYLPIIGLLIGGFLWCISLLDLYLDRPIVAIFIWLGYLWITGGLHIDGLADSIDGLFSNRDRDRTLEIMKDSRIGTFGVLAIVFVTLLNISLTFYIDFKVLIMIPVMGRASAILASSISNYARDGMGMCRAFIEDCGIKEVIAAMSIAIAIGTIFFTYHMVVAMVLSLVLALLLTRYISIRIGGMTGDTVGAIIEVSQVLFLLFYYVLTRINL